MKNCLFILFKQGTSFIGRNWAWNIPDQFELLGYLYHLWQ